MASTNSACCCYGHDNNAYWYGSQLSIEETRKLAPYQNATGLQVTSAVLGGMVWALENPNEGIVEADEMDFDRLLEIQMPYLGPVKGFYTDWTPLDRPARDCSRRISTPRIRGSSGTCWCGEAPPAHRTRSSYAGLTRVSIIQETRITGVRPGDGELRTCGCGHS